MKALIWFWFGGLALWTAVAPSGSFSARSSVLGAAFVSVKTYFAFSTGMLLLSRRRSRADVAWLFPN